MLKRDVRGNPRKEEGGTSDAALILRRAGNSEGTGSFSAEEGRKKIPAPKKEKNSMRAFILSPKEVSGKGMVGGLAAMKGGGVFQRGRKGESRMTLSCQRAWKEKEKQVVLSGTPLEDVSARSIREKAKISGKSPERAKKRNKGGGGQSALAFLRPVGRGVERQTTRGERGIDRDGGKTNGSGMNEKKSGIRGQRSS